MHRSGWAARGAGAGRPAAGPGPRRGTRRSLDPELHGLPLGIPAGVLREGEEHWRLRSRRALGNVLYPFGHLIAMVERGGCLSLPLVADRLVGNRPMSGGEIDALAEKACRPLGRLGP